MDGFTTERLAVRDWRSDLDNRSRRRVLETSLAAILSPRVLEHLPPPLQLDQQGNDIAGWISARAVESDVLLISETGQDDLIGLLILATDEEPTRGRTIRIGYLLAESAWGKGYATELVLGLVSAMKASEPVTLIGGVGNGNDASARVLMKAGFQNDRALSDAETDIYTLSLGQVGGGPAGVSVSSR